MKKKIALVFGITGQDGSYLTELLLNKNYKVYGVKRRTSLIHTTRIDHIYKDFHLKTNLILKYGDVTDFSNVFNSILFWHKKRLAAIYSPTIYMQYHRRNRT